MIDTANKGGVDSKGFLEAAKECLEAENKVRSHHIDVHAVLQRMSQYLRSHTVSKAEMICCCSFIEVFLYSDNIFHACLLCMCLNPSNILGRRTKRMPHS